MGQREHAVKRAGWASAPVRSGRLSTVARECPKPVRSYLY
ncbi:Uncharacterised protein [Vibrio cholerae]|nr:Uncharacterised protein [Vibrio cholerae]